MRTYTFQEVKRTRTDKYRCPCGKRFQRTVSATQTINPFNRNADGNPKTYPEIWQELGPKVAGLKSDPTCAGCGAEAGVIAVLVDGVKVKVEGQP